jgi:hypothetical protein
MILDPLKWPLYANQIMNHEMIEQHVCSFLYSRGEEENNACFCKSMPRQVIEMEASL